MKIKHDHLHHWITEVFTTKGFSLKDARICADVLVSADLRGIDSHGVARLSGYVRLIDKGRINPTPTFKISQRRKTMIHLDADSGIGLLSAQKGMEMAIEITAEYGSGWVGISNSNHFGIAAYHAMKALEHDFIGFAMTNASPLVTPAWGKQRMLGTNPICVAIPANKEIPFVLDMATSAAANGKLEISERQNKPIPSGWALDKNGEIDTRAETLKDGGMLLPLGSNENGSFHKGYGLGSWVDIFSGVITGANFGPWVPPFVSFLDPLPNLPGKGIGHFLGCWDIDGFQEPGQSKLKMDQWIQEFKKTNALHPEKSRVIIPGEPEYFLQESRKISGIPILDKVSIDIENLSIQLGIPTPL